MMSHDIMVAMVTGNTEGYGEHPSNDVWCVFKWKCTKGCLHVVHGMWSPNRPVYGLITINNEWLINQGQQRDGRDIGQQEINSAALNTVG